MEYKILDDKIIIKQLIEFEFEFNYKDFFKENIKIKFDSIVNEIDCASVLIKQEEIVAFSFHRFVDLNHKYFSDSPSDVVNYLTTKNKLLMTTEYLTVGSKFKNLFTKIHPTEIMISLNMRYMKSSIADAIIGHSRQDLKTDKISMRVGTRSIGVVSRFGIPCSIVYCEKHNVKGHPNDKIEKIISEIWSSRQCLVHKFNKGVDMYEIEFMNNEIKKLNFKIKSLNWSNNAVYAQWLSQAYYIAKRSTAFLGLCLFHSDKYPDFQKRCTDHIAEETGHEKLILNDIKRLGYVLLPELAQTAAIYQPQYFRIIQNPLSFLGYVFFLELLAPEYGPYVMKHVPNDAQSFLKVHASADEDHVIQATEIFKNLDENSKAEIINNFLMGISSYSAMLDRIAELDHRVEMVV